MKEQEIRVLTVEPEEITQEEIEEVSVISVYVL